MSKKKAERVFRSAEQKQAIVAEFLNPGNATKAEVAEKHNVSPQQIYGWIAKIDRGEPLEYKPLGKKTAKHEVEEPALPPERQRLDAAMERAKARMLSRKAANAPATIMSHQTEIMFERLPTPQADQLYMELAVLRSENEKLKRALQALTSAITQ